MFFYKETPESPRMFDNDLLDAMSRTHWLTVPAVYGPASLILMWYSVQSAGWGIGESLGLFVGGVIAWTFVEYVLHRTLFHWIPEGDWGETIHFFLHGHHHVRPDDPYRLVMPPTVSLSLFVIFLFVWTFTLGSAGWAWHAGFTFGYMCYDSIHYLQHHGRMHFSWLKKVKKHHMAHHFHPDYEELKYGVSTRLWDFVFGTDELDEDEERKHTREKLRGE